MTLWLSYWWCDHCCVEVPKEHATIAHTHALAGGGCGKRLTERFNSTEPPEDDELAAVAEALYVAGCKLQHAKWRPDPADIDTFKPVWSEFVLALERFGFTPRFSGAATLTAERDAALAEVQRLRAAAGALLAKLDVALPKLDGLCSLAAVHGAPYSGPTVHEEMAVLRALVSPP